MAVRVLVVDDSSFFRRRVTEMLNADPRIEVIGTAADGLEAIKQTATLKPDVITMDIEMPVMDGITAVRRIMRSLPTPILMFSSLTTDGAKATLDALDAGAADFLPKKFEDISEDRDEARRILCARVRLIGARGVARAATPAAVASKAAATPSPVAPGKRPRKGDYDLVAIGTSTGGPVALQDVLTRLPANFPKPIILIQHMPGSFTPAFAQRLDSLCQIAVKEAADGDILKPGLALLAPGGKQMELESRGGSVRVRIKEAAPGQTYKPSVDLGFSSAAKVFPGKVLSIILTGMGADGREGARELKQGGSTLWSQDADSCVVYGMPAAVADAGLSDYILPLSEIGPSLAQAV
ncbi:chemotaxis response regulator protein-glutamate methylesterase [Sulfuriflexus sp.]|uniref:protein-glutamate methylesterase/protein-glutamine glutaminase n=1 Tax=Sulfuriflexus sp. TaxID=2015443 RepID=UPI0028CEDA2B|nr:chemotaxis response regulator protein-glutamate methylesterase [Sulfuriflexus sp.]MDT8403909.1 chemotaxis response regulator protein-glutamate methylesterase [Sulfuriflexus sp.]